MNNSGVREDADLVEDFVRAGGTFLSNAEDLENWNMKDRSLGLFSDSHMEWEMYRARSPGPRGQPSLTQMTRSSIQAREIYKGESKVVIQSDQNSTNAQ